MAGKKTFRQQLEDLASAEAIRALRCYFYLKTQSWEEAEDVVQDAFVSAWKNIDGFKGESELRTWFISIAINCWFMRRRKGGKKHKLQRVDDLVEQAVLYSLTDPHNHFNEVDACLDYEKVMAIINRMPRCYRVTMTMRGQGMMYKEIGVALGVNIGTVKSHVNRGKVKLIQALEQRRGPEVYQPQ